MQQQTNLFFSYLFFIFLCFGTNQAFSQNIETDTLEIISISDINYKIEKSKRTISKIHFSNTDKYNLYKLDSIIDKEKIFFKSQADDFYSFKTENLSKIFLANTFKIWSEYDRRLKNAQIQNNESFEKIDKNTQNLIRLSKEFKNIKSELSESNNFNIITKKVNEILVDIELKKKEQYTILKKIIEVEDKLNNLLVFVDKTLDYTQGLLNKKKVETFKHTNPYIWNTVLDDGKYPNLKARFVKAFNTNIKLITSQYFLVKNNIPKYFIALIALVFLIFRLHKNYLKYYNLKSSLKITNIFINHYKSIILIFSILLVFVMFPSTPIVLSNTLAAILLLFSANILKAFIPKNVIQLILRFFFILILYNIETLAWYFAGYARLYFILEVGIATTILTLYYLKYIKTSSFTTDRQVLILIKKTIPFIIGGYIVSAIAQILGFMNLSILLNKVLIIIPTISIIIYTAYTVLNVLIITLNKVLGSKYVLFKQLFPKFKKRLFLANKIFILFYWYNITASSFQLDRFFSEYISNIFDYPIIMNPYDLTLGDLLSLIIILITTYYIAIIIAKIFDNDNVKKSKKSSRGIYAALSLTIRMAVVLFGLAFAMSKIGIDMSKFSIMAGALGVGIGFGLQDLVKNFISGLILIYGRPIQVGDTVEIEALMGIVNHIGVRSSTLTTYDGAEVLVPNSLLISNTLTNWTLSDNKKRIEVFLGVAYGTDPEIVIALMKQAASEIDLILKDPPPQGLFLEFGDSSLNFRLRFWTLFEDGFEAKSDVSILINKMLNEKDITVPFPQLDVHHLHDKKEDES